jgi:hypothetical protein
MQPGAETSGGIPTWVKIGGAGLLGVVGYYWYKNRQSSAASAATTTTSTAYGQPATGTGVIEPIIIGAGGGSPSTPAAPPPTSTGGSTAAPPPTSTPAAPPPTSTPAAPPPTSTGGGTAAPIPAAIPTLSQSPLNYEVGVFSQGLRTPSLAAVQAESAALHNNLLLQAWNVGQLAQLNHLKTPTMAQIKALAAQMYPDFSQMDTTSQDIAMEEANVQLMGQLNNRPGFRL